MGGAVRRYGFKIDDLAGMESRTQLKQRLKDAKFINYRSKGFLAHMYLISFLELKEVHMIQKALAAVVNKFGVFQALLKLHRRAEDQRGKASAGCLRRIHVPH